MYSDNPVRDALQRDLDYEEWAARFPHCWNCGEPIPERGIHITPLSIWLCRACVEDMEEETDYEY